MNEDQVISTPNVAEQSELIVNGTLLVGRYSTPRHLHCEIANADILTLLSTPHPPDTVISLTETSGMEVVDIDTHRWPQPPTEAQLDATMAAMKPLPNVFFRTQGNGLRALFVGPAAEKAALASVFSVPRSFEIELVKIFRHPLSTDSRRPHAQCGPVVTLRVEPYENFALKEAAELDEHGRSEVLHVLGLIEGGRYHHDRCPIDATTDSTARDCVVVLEDCIYCHRCVAKGVCAPDCDTPGVYPLTQIAKLPLDYMNRLVCFRVHYSHAKKDLKAKYPHIPATILHNTYYMLLCEKYQDDGIPDPRVPMVFNRDLNTLWGDGVWLDEKSLKPTHFDNDLANSLPYCQGVRVSLDPPQKTAVVLKARRARAKYRTPEGYRK